jgi:hypothetical protein
VDVHAHFQSPGAVFDQDRLEPFPVQVAGPVVLPVVPDPVTAVQPLNRLAEISVRRADQQMIMVRHQAVRIHMHPETFTEGFHQLKKVCVIPSLRIDPLPVVAPAEYMIPPPAHSNPDRSCPVAFLSASLLHVNQYV